MCIRDRLIDQAGLKSLTMGSARISPQNSNYLLVGNEATSEEVLKLVDKVRDEIQIRFDVELEPAFEVW